MPHPTSSPSDSPSQRSGLAGAASTTDLNPVARRDLALSSLLLAILTFFLIAPALARAADSPPIDVVFVLDNSGSMKINDPQFLTRELVTEFTTEMVDEGADARFGMVVFDGDARLASPLVDLWDDAAREQFVEKLADVNYKGQRTDSAAGIERGIYELRAKGREGARKAVVFLTDGFIDTGDPVRDATQRDWLLIDLAADAKADGIEIYGIAFTESADLQLIQSLALTTQGEYYRAFASEELRPVLASIQTRLEAPEQVAEVPVPPVPTAIPPTPPVLPTPVAAPTPPESRLLERALAPLALLLFLGGAYALYARGRAPTPITVVRAAEPPVDEEPPPTAHLIDLKKATGRDPYPIVLDEDLVSIGRDPHNRVAIPTDTISSQHATIERKKGFFFLEDRRSTNGTRLNGEKIEANQPVQLRAGDRITFADYDFQFVIPDYTPAGQTRFLTSTHGSNDSQPIEVGHAGEPEARATRFGSHAIPVELRDATNVGMPAVRPVETPPEPESGRGEVVRVDFGRGAPESEPAAPVDEPVEPVREVPAARDDATLIDVPVRAADDAPEAPQPDPDAVVTAEQALRSEPVGALPPAEAEPEPAATQPAPDSIGRGLLTSAQTTADVADLAAVGEVAAARGADEQTTPLGLEEADEEPEAEPEVEEAATQPVLRDEPVEETPAEVDFEQVRGCLRMHLSRIAELGDEYAAFVERHFDPDVEDALAATARELLREAASGHECLHREYANDGVLYVVYAVPDEMENAAGWFEKDHGGFTRLITRFLYGDSFFKNQCQVLCLITYGHHDLPWVSMTIATSPENDEPIDLLSYEFLSEAEREKLASVTGE